MDGPRYRVHERLLSRAERELVGAHAIAERNRFEGGRQAGGYAKLALAQGSEGDVGRADTILAELVARCRARLAPLPSAELGRAQWVAFDAYLLRYDVGAFIPPHVDPPLADGNRHLRLNAIVLVPERGGELRLDGERVELAAGDAVVFRPDLREHAVSVVEGSPRLVLSVGCNYRLAPSR